MPPEAPTPLQVGPERLRPLCPHSVPRRASSTPGSEEVLWAAPGSAPISPGLAPLSLALL